MQVDSFAFLPRSFRPLYENPAPLAGEDRPVWAAFGPRLAEARIALLSSAGLHHAATQEPFDAERERAEPTWGDPTWRAVPHGVRDGELGMTHLHLNGADILEDHQITLPDGVLADLVAAGTVGSHTPEHVSVMGYQEAGLKAWKEHTAPAVIARLRDHGADGVVLAPA